MWDSIFYFITVPMVYLAFAWFIVGAVVRTVRALGRPRHPFTLKIFPDRDHPVPGAVGGALAMPTVRRHKPRLWFFLMLFHIGLALLILAHLDLLPFINLMPTGSEHMIGWGAVGAAVTLSCLYFLFRRFKTPVRDISVPADYLLLFLLFAVFMSGDIISWGNSWNSEGFVITKQDFGAYLESLVLFTWEDPREILEGSHYVVMVVHVLLANLMLLILPFSKLMHAFTAIPLNAIRRG